MAEDDRYRWDEKWAGASRIHEPNSYLRQWRAHLGTGIALDVACGLGQNSVYLAQHGYSVVGVDVSRVALQRAWEWARHEGVAPQTLFAQVDLDRWRPPDATLDLICVFKFLDRALIPSLKRALRSGGLLLYQTPHVGLLERQPDATVTFLLQRGELRRFFAEWTVLAYEETAENAAILVRKGD
jgi:tellurite methyltransferase